MPRIILASQSPRRKTLLSQLGFDFDVYPSETDEDIDEQHPPLLVEKLALLKAKDVSGAFTDSMIIGADTVVVHEGEILGKPRDAAEAINYLTRLSGTSHNVFTGVALVQTNSGGLITAEKTFHEQTKVFFSPLSKHEIDAYIESGSPFDKAGAYGIQDDMGAVFVEKIEGDFYNVVGFPLNRFYQELKIFSPELVQIKV